MSLERLDRWKNRIAKASAVVCVFVLLCILDGSAAYLREPFNSMQVVPGATVKLTGPLPPNVGIEGMAFESSSDGISMSLQEVISGFWMGGRMWRGTITIGPDVSPGEYVVSVFGTDDRKKVGANTFLVLVYKDEASIAAHSKSFVRKNTGVSPWTAAGMFFSIVLLGCAALYVVGSRRDRLMAEEGEAEVFHITRSEEAVSIYFGLGSRHGVGKGTRLLLLDRKRQPVEEITVESVSEKDGLAKLGPLSAAVPGYIVKRL